LAVVTIIPMFYAHDVLQELSFMNCGSDWRQITERCWFCTERWPI